jgi:hypothetical protein
LSPQALWVEGSHEGPWRELSTLVQPAPPIRLFSSLEDLGGALSRFGAHLSCVGVAGPSARLEPLNKALLSAGVRICALGEMQRPPLSWRNGGLSLVHLLSSQIR